MAVYARAVHPLKAFAPTSVTVFDKETDAREVHPENAHVPTVVAPLLTASDSICSLYDAHGTCASGS